MSASRRLQPVSGCSSLVIRGTAGSGIVDPLHRTYQRAETPAERPDDLSNGTRKADQATALKENTCLRFVTARVEPAGLGAKAADAIVRLS
jgi:hypothetical protein